MEPTLMDQAATTNEGETQDTAAQVEQQPAGEQQQTETQEPQGEQQEAKPEGAPETYEFKAPEGQQFDTTFLKTFEETARELNLSQDNAQKIIDKLSPVLQQTQMERIEAVRNEWADTAKVDKEFGGDKLNENLAVAKQALDKFGTPELKQLMNESGLGNHPEVVRFFYRAGKAISEDTVVTGNKGNSSGAPKTFNDFADKLYT